MVWSVTRAIRASTQASWHCRRTGSPTVSRTPSPLQAVSPTSISNFGQTGPSRDWRAQDLTLYGMGGEMYTSGATGREPLKQAHNLTLYQGGAVAATATMVGLMG